MLSSPRARWLWTTLAILFVAAVSLCLAVCLNGRDDSLERARQRGVLRVGYAVNPPYVIVDGSDSPHGIAVDTIPSIARSLGIPRIEWVQTSYQTLIPELLDRRFDLVASQLGPTPEREALVRFSRSVITVRYGVLVAKGNPHHVGGYSTLMPKAGQVIALTRQSVAERELRRRGFTDENLLLAAVGEGGEAALRVGAAQALVRTQPSLAFTVQSHPDEFEMIEEPAAGPGAPAMSTAYAFHPRDEALRKAWDGVLGPPASPDRSR